MAKKASQVLKEAKGDYGRLVNELDLAIEIRDEFNRQLRNARNRLSRRENTNRPDILANQFIRDIKKGNQLPFFLMSAISNATEENEEFQDEGYAEALLSVAQEKDIYSLSKEGSGWAIRIDANIVFEEEAGTLDDWGNAVESYRESVLKSKGLDDEEKGEKASEFFADKVYGQSLHTKTIRGRLGVSAAGGKKAPFWEILNNGTSPLVSDRPGGSSPVTATPTDFIGEAETLIESEFLVKIAAEHDKFQQEEAELRDLVEDYEAQRDEMTEQVGRLRTDVKLNEAIYQSFGRKKKYVDQNKLARVIEQMETSRENRRVNIAKRGSGQQLFINVLATEGLIEY